MTSMSMIFASRKPIDSSYDRPSTLDLRDNAKLHTVRAAKGKIRKSAEDTQHSPYRLCERLAPLSWSPRYERDLLTETTPILDTFTIDLKLGYQQLKARIRYPGCSAKNGHTLLQVAIDLYLSLCARRNRTTQFLRLSSDPPLTASSKSMQKQHLETFLKPLPTRNRAAVIEPFHLLYTSPDDDEESQWYR
ncbi:hypothetical protein TNCV_4487161 [Trichonephila clavipes]|nr:hypothetical protein TNCV_4487161 [Trichonephila clavipes]